jgi:hypothetical protein
VCANNENKFLAKNFKEREKANGMPFLLWLTNAIIIFFIVLIFFGCKDINSINFCVDGCYLIFMIFLLFTNFRYVRDITLFTMKFNS